MKPSIIEFLDASAGLTRLEAEAALQPEPRSPWSNHARFGVGTEDSDLEEVRLAEPLSRPGRFQLARWLGFAQVVLQAFLDAMRKQGQPSAKGVLLLSPPGCGKSQFCKCLGRETGRPVLILDVGNLMGSLVGQSEQRMRDALSIVDAMSPCIVMIDEVEKAFSGASAADETLTRGVSTRMFGTFLTWLNDHQSDAYVVCTSNDVRRLPPEFGRSERFDGIFFLDLPTANQREAIWTQYLHQYGIDSETNGVPRMMHGREPKSRAVVGWPRCWTCLLPRRLRTSCRSRRPPRSP